VAMGRSGLPRALLAASALAAAGWLLARARQRRRSRDTERTRRKRIFLSRAGHAYGYGRSAGGHVERWRPDELPQLVQPAESERASENERVVYLDYAGAALPLASQLQALARHASATVLANPHSSGPAASATAAQMEHARALVLAHFCGSHAPDWECVWTSGTTAALRLVAEVFPFGEGSTLILPESCHTSVMGMRGPAGAKGALCLCAGSSRDYAELAAKGAPTSARASHLQVLVRHSLAVVTAECNLTGDRTDSASIAHSLSRVSAGKDALPGTSSTRWWVLVDGAKAAATGELDMPSTGAAFCAVSFYKMFGVPTGLGALLVRRDALRLLRKDLSHAYFGGGAVAAALPRPIRSSWDVVQQSHPSASALSSSSATANTTIVRPAEQPGGAASSSALGPARFFNPPKVQVAEALVDGTLHFLGISWLQHGFEELRRVGGSRAVARHAGVLAEELVARLASLRHATGVPVVEIYGNWKGRGRDHKATTEGVFSAPSRLSGPTVAFNVLRYDGSYVGYAEVGKLASLNRPPIQLRTGCCCNPGGCQALLNMTEADVLAAVAAGKQCGDHLDLLNGRPTGVVRASLGKDSTWEDVDHLVCFIEKTFVLVPADRAARAKLARDAMRYTHSITHEPDVTFARPLVADLSHGVLHGPSVQDSEERQSSAIPSPSLFRLTAIYVHPIKSCGGMRVSRWPLDCSNGRLLYDREWALAGPSGVLLRSTAYPRIALIRPTVDLDQMVLRVSAPGLSDLEISLRQAMHRPEGSVVSPNGGEHSEGTDESSDAIANEHSDGTHVSDDQSNGQGPSLQPMQAGMDEEPLTLCGEECYGWAVGDVETNKWFEQAVGVPCRLVRAADGRRSVIATTRTRRRASSDELARGGGEPSGSIGFANDAPLLLVSQTAVDTLNGELLRSGEKAVAAASFRPNMVVEPLGGTLNLPLNPGHGPEDGWNALRLTSPRSVEAPIELRVVGLCARCSMVELDPSSGTRHGSVLRTLASYRRSKAQINFGIFCELVRHADSRLEDHAIAQSVGIASTRMAKAVTERLEDLTEVGALDQGCLFVDVGALVDPILSPAA